MPDPWLYNAIATGAPKVAVRSPGSVFVFLVPLPGTLFRSEFRNTMLITFFLVISFTSWWLKWHYTFFYNEEYPFFKKKLFFFEFLKKYNIFHLFFLCYRHF
jgi:hypothetical protein